MNRNLIFLKWDIRPVLTCLLAVCLLAGCSLPSASSGGVAVWIDVPLDGLSFAEVQAIKIEGHASSAGAISRVEIWINGVMLTSIANPPMEGGLASFHAEWTPSAPGEYTIQAIAFGADGTSSSPDSARVVFGSAAPASGCPTPVGGGPTPVSCGEAPGSGCPTLVGGGPTPVSCVTPVITITPTLPPPASPVIQFWAEPPSVMAGACTAIRWHVESVNRVIFGGMDQPFDGSYSDCLCTSQRYTLQVIHVDGSEETRTLEVGVNGTCDTPTLPPPSDATPPPAPSLVVPANGLSIACKAAQSLAWLPVSDPSGIREYQVQVQRHSGNNNWLAAPGGAIIVADKTTSVPVECGWYYRWRVRAVDNAGNTGDWSGWFLFTITLS